MYSFWHPQCLFGFYNQTDTCHCFIFVLGYISKYQNQIYDHMGCFVRTFDSFILLIILNAQFHIPIILGNHILPNGSSVLQLPWHLSRQIVKQMHCYNSIVKTFYNFMAPFYGWGSTASRLVPLWGGSLLFTTKFPDIPGTHFINLGRMKGWVDLGATQWFWEQDPYIGNPAP